MYNKILVTLDGSSLSEAVLPYVAEFVRIAGSEEVVLLSVVEGGGEREINTARGYLKDRASQLKKTWEDTVFVQPHVKVESVRAQWSEAASTILRFAEDNAMDMIVLSTHGRSGIDRWLIGSVADKVLRGADIPVFLIRAVEGCPEPPSGLDHILVPLDGSELAEEVLPYVERFAKTCLERCEGSAPAKVTPLYVEPEREGDSLGRIFPPSGFGRYEGEESHAYLTSIASGLAGSGADVKTKIRTGQPVQQILEEAGEGLVDLIVMSSHGRSGLARWAYGSVADQVLRSSPVPVLLVQAAGKGSVPQHLQGPLAHRCNNCGRRAYIETLSVEHRCSRCHFFLKSCKNCVHYNGVACLMELPHSTKAYPGNSCPEFQFRKTRLVLH